MSQEKNSQPRNEGGQRRQGNNNRNRNRNRNRDKQGGNRQSGQGRQSGGGPKSPQRRRHSKPVPLTTWEKILKFFGLYKKPTRPPRRQSGGQTNEASQTKSGQKPAKSNTRNAQGRGDKKVKRSFPVETPRLYLGNLSYDADESSLEELFKGVGTVRSVEIVYNRHTHRSKGFGFIEMQNVDEAKRAVEELHDKPFMGRNLVVNGANNKPKEDRPQRERKPREPRESKPKQERGEKRNNAARLHLDNLSFDADESALEDLFKGIGNVRRVELVYNRQTHKSKGFGFIEMQKAEDAQRAIEVLHDQPFMGRKLVVSEAKDKTPRENKPETTEVTETPATEEAAPQTAVETTPVEAAPTEATVEATKPITETTGETAKTTAE